MKEDPTRNDKRALAPFNRLEVTPMDKFMGIGFMDIVDHVIKDELIGLHGRIDDRTLSFDHWVKHRCFAFAEKFNCEPYKSNLQRLCDKFLNQTGKAKPPCPKILVPVFDPGAPGFALVTLIWTPLFTGAASGNWSVVKDLNWYKLEMSLEKNTYIPAWLEEGLPSGSIH